MRWQMLLPLALAAFFFLPVTTSGLSPLNAPGDTLTVIMSPLLNVPAIHIPGETLVITCIAPSTTTAWQAQLLHGSREIALTINSSQYLQNPARWELQATVPQVPVFELYDLKVTASGGIEDVTRNAVQIIPTRKTNYYFIHITDLHLPTRIYYPDAGFDSDSTSVNDFRSVIDDINLINPEFVLLTGDLLNEGELEGFAGQYWYGWTQRLLEEINVPCFVTVGNHDVGGWNSTPPPQGSARRNWWRYFGWPWLNNPDPAWQLHTQDYDFVYGSLQFIGLEGYDNYDNWRANIYGSQSFTQDQILWLNGRLGLYPDKTKVLFYHYDYSDQLNLSQLGAALGLWGHIHYNSGSIGTYPYNLATRSVCNGNRAYRLIRVVGSQVQPQETSYAGASGTNLSVSYFPANDATADSLLAIVTNNQNLAFEQARLRFRLRPGNYSYHVTNGILEQVDRSSSGNTCYVQANLAAHSVLQISVAESGTENDDPLQTPQPLILSAYPNPFHERLNLVLDSKAEPVQLRIYNLRGEQIADLGAQPSGAECVWDCSNSAGNSMPAGIYYVRASNRSGSELKRIVKY